MPALLLLPLDDMAEDAVLLGCLNPLLGGGDGGGAWIGGGFGLSVGLLTEEDDLVVPLLPALLLLLLFAIDSSSNSSLTCTRLVSAAW